MSNTASWAATIRTQGTVFNPYANGQVAPIAPEDIAAVAARALTSRDFANQILDLTGEQLITIPEQVSIIAKLLDQPLRSVEIPVAAATERMRESGMPAELADSLGQMMESVRSGSVLQRSDSVRRILGREAMPFAAWADRHRNIWSKN
jgi:uncharacterized protein YbjT (DUF2867 family)